MPLPTQYHWIGQPPTPEDLAIVNQQLPLLYEQFPKLFDQSTPKFVWNDPRIDSPRINAAYFPDENLISFKTGRTSIESVRHEVYHGAQKAYHGASYCDSRDCEIAAYEFEKMYGKSVARVQGRVLMRLEQKKARGRSGLPDG